ncbi:MAG: ABC transporter permease, partial [Bacteroidota bacterium]
MNTLESILLAIDSIRVNKLRASLTLLSIAIGVFAIVGAGSLAGSINETVTGEMAELGENSFQFKRMPSIQMGDTWRKYRSRKPLNYSQYEELRKNITLTDMVSAASTAGANTIRYDIYETDPDVNLVGAEDMYFRTNNIDLETGRAFTNMDIEFNRKIAIIGNDIVVDLFPNQSPIGKEIKIKNQQYTVIGVLTTKGALLGQSQDNQVIVPITQFLKYHANRWDESLNIHVRAISKEALSATIDEAIGIMRTVRNIKPWEENSFELETNESISEQFAGLTGFLSIFGIISGAFALIAAGVGIMNIMLVSVKERTKEIGVRKAVGAKKFWILLQFIIETVTLCQIGGLIGILFGVGASWLFGMAFNVTLDLPVVWIIAS